MSDAASQEIAVIEGRMTSDRAGYLRDEGMQQRYRDLLDAREAGAPAALPAKSGGRIAEIEAVMKADRARYFRDEALQREYHDLLAAAHPEPASEDRAPAPARAREAVAAVSSAEARAILGDHEPEALERAGGKVRAVFGALGEGTAARDLEATFGTLPPAVRAGIVAEMGRPEAGYVRVATPDEIGAIRTMPGVPELLTLWGPAAPRKLGIALEAYNRFRGGLSANDRAQFVGFWRHLPAREKVLTLWALGGA
jgi:hypothetical protein